MQIFLSNSLTRQKELFIPLDEHQVKMYACGPTVYDRPHLGNARAAVVYDILFRLLRHAYPRVIYVRNITDVDDKIIHAAAASGISVEELTTQMTEFYHADIRALNCLEPTVEPMATAHVPQMIAMIELLVQNGHAYVAQGHVLFDVASDKSYGHLARRSLEEMIAGARVEVAPFKRNAGDFVLWKPTKENEAHCSFASPWGQGRPGWHIECSAMSLEYLGQDFDIHGGGADLMFPHHENELAQSKCANQGSSFARYWVHNGFLTVDGEKMSKSLGNFKTVRDMLDSGVEGAAIRYCYLATHYKKPLDLSDKALFDAQKALHKFRAVLVNAQEGKTTPCAEVIKAVADDMNTPLALAWLHKLAGVAASESSEALAELSWGLDFLGLKLEQEEENAPHDVIKLAEERLLAKKERDWKTADVMRERISGLGYKVVDLQGSYKLEKIKES